MLRYTAGRAGSLETTESLVLGDANDIECDGRSAAPRQTWSLNVEAPAELVALDSEVGLSFVANALLTTSAVMLAVGLLACVEPARCALRIDPTAALKEA